MGRAKSSIQAANNAELAEKLGVSRQTLYAWKKQPGAPKDLDLEKWLRFAQTVARKSLSSVKQATTSPVKPKTISVDPPAPPDEDLDDEEDSIGGSLDTQERKLVAEARRAELAGDKLEIEIGELRKKYLPAEQVSGAILDACTRLKTVLRRNESEIPGQVAGKDARVIQTAIAEGNDKALAAFLAQIKKLLAGEAVPL